MNGNIINICFVNDKLLDTFYSNPQKITECIRENPYDTKWLKEFD